MNNHLVIHIVHQLYAYGYWILFPLVVIEGPLVTILAGFLASLKFFNIFLAYAVVVLADLTGDIIYYCAGRWWLNRAFNRTLAFFSLSKSRVEKIEQALKKNRGKVLFFGKLSHVVGVVILFAAGHAEVPFADYVWYNFLATLPKSLVLILVGYYFGSSISNFNRYLDFTVLGLVGFTAVFLAAYFIIAYFSNKEIIEMEKKVKTIS